MKTKNVYKMTPVSSMYIGGVLETLPHFPTHPRLVYTHLEAFGPVANFGSGHR